MNAPAIADSIAPVAIPTAATPAAGSRFGRLGPFSQVGLDASACLHHNKPWVACRECADACPAACLDLDGQAMHLNAGACLACGRCARVCPTGALTVEGFSLLTADAGPVLTLACTRQTDAPPPSIQVPCLGGLHENDLLALLVKHPFTALCLCDDNRCADCASGHASEAPARQLCTAITPILRSSLGSTDRVTVWEPPSKTPGSNSRNTATDPNRPEQPAASCRTSRRAFFSGLGRAVSNSVVNKTSALGFAATHIDPARLGKTPRRPIPWSRAADTRLLMRQLASGAQGAPASALLPGIDVSDRCLAHGICTRLCPTGALRLNPLGNARQLSFDAWQCIDCGACQSACPEAALTFHAPAWRAFSEEIDVLSSVRTQDCDRCGDTFVASDNTGLCGHCSKSQSLSQAGFALFRRGGSTQPAETGPP